MSDLKYTLHKLVKGMPLNFMRSLFFASISTAKILILYLDFLFVFKALINLNYQNFNPASEKSAQNFLLLK